MNVTHYESATKGPVAIADMHALHIANALARLEKAERTREPVYAALLAEQQRRADPSSDKIGGTPAPSLGDIEIVRAPAKVAVDRSQSNEVSAGPVRVTLDRAPSNFTRAQPSVGARPIRFGKR